MEGTPDLTQYKTTDITRDVSYYGNGCPGNSDLNIYPCSSRIAGTYDDVELQKNGTIYTFQAASVGTGSSITTANTNAPDTFCPLGWQVPYGGTGGDYYDQSRSWRYLITSYNYDFERQGSINVMSYPIDIARSGSFQINTGALYYLNNVSQSWTSTGNGASAAYRLNVWIGAIHDEQAAFMATGQTIRSDKNFPSSCNDYVYDL